MESPDTVPAVQGVPIARNRREVIRFLSHEERLKAFQVLMDLHERHQFSVYRDPNEWWIYTDTLRKLREHGVQFKWLTENV